MSSFLCCRGISHAFCFVFSLYNKKNPVRKWLKVENKNEVPKKLAVKRSVSDWLIGWFIQGLLMVPMNHRMSILLNKT